MTQNRILVVDDEEILTRTFANLLKRQGYKVLTASHSKNALAIVEKEDFDLLLCDVRMPGENGVITARKVQELRRSKGKGDVPIIFLTGFADERIEAEAKELRPIAYIYKPFDTFELLNLINTTMQSH